MQRHDKAMDDAWTHLYQLGDRLARILDTPQGPNGSPRRWIAAIPRSKRKRMTAVLAAVATLGKLLQDLIPPEPPNDTPSDEQENRAPRPSGSSLTSGSSNGSAR